MPKGSLDPIFKLNGLSVHFRNSLKRNLLKFTAITIAYFAMTSSVMAVGDRDDYDLDNDGLIEINDLNDLDQIRYHLDGSALYGSSAGCPEEPADPDQVSGCFGFELTQNLDFDTNQDGKLDGNDDYWNEGMGWVPIDLVGSGSLGFKAVFEGNGFSIQNLYIHAPLAYHSGYRKEGIGLFGYLANHSEVRNLALTGPLAHINGYDYTAGAIAGSAWGADLKNIYSTVSVTGKFAVGLVGSTEKTGFENIFVSGTINARWGGDGVTRDTNDQRPTSIRNAVVVSTFSGQASSPFGTRIEHVENSYWSTELTGIEGSTTSIEALKCSHNDEQNPCSDFSIYENFNTDATQNVYWDMGNGQQFPALIMHGKTYRDSDGDGLLDSEDDVPLNHDAFVDADGDGAVDVWNPACDESCREASGLSTDQLPTIAAAYLDGDLDSLPDMWAEGCDEACQLASGVQLDEHLNDTDNDGIPNDVDTDDDGDGQRDVDSNSNGLLEIHTLAQLNSIRYQLNGNGLRNSYSDELNTAGCPVVFLNGKTQRACHGFELMNDLDFDTNQDGVLNEQDEFWNDGKGWLPLGYVNEVSSRTIENLYFDGKRNTIKNLFIHRSSPYTGLFAFVNKGRVLQLNLNGHLTSIQGGSQIGLVAGKMTDGVLNHVNVKGPVFTGGNSAGALVGQIQNSLVRSVTSDSFVIGQRSVGGLFGNADDTQISESHAWGDVAGEYAVAGLVGFGDVTIDFSTVDAKVVGGESVGGLIGYANGGSEITNSIVEGTVIGNKMLGGAIGRNFYGAKLNGVVTNVYIGVKDQSNTSDDEWGTYVGGLIGWDHTGIISNVYVMGRINGKDKVGGLLGVSVHRNSDIQNALILAKVSLMEESEGDAMSGGIIGSDEFGYSGTIRNTYWATDATSQVNSGFQQGTYGNEYGVTLNELACPMTRDYVGCADITLFENWPDDHGLNVHWKFGYITDLPKLSIGSLAFVDSDQDGHMDHVDQFDYDNTRYLDTDNDGYPDKWPRFCDEECRTNSDYHLDNLPDHPQASLDTDGDGRPEAFHDDCLAECQLNSGLVLDEYPNDFDNDGVPDSHDRHPGDDGAPILEVSGEQMNLSVDNEIGTEGKLVFNQAFFEHFTISDAVDPSPDLYLLTEDADDEFVLTKVVENEFITLPAGHHQLRWVAIDDAENPSNIKIVRVNVYPRLQFSRTEKTVSERSDATIEIIATAALPGNEVTVLLQVDTENTTLLQSDLDEFGFQLDGSELLPVQVKQVSNSEGGYSWIGHLEVPLVQDGTGEPDKQLVVTLDSIADGSAGKGIMELNPDAITHTLTVNDGNLPPEVTLTITQGGQPVTEVKRDLGMVTITATAVDPDVGDQIANVKWESNDAALVYWLEQVMTWEFDPSSMDGGEYWIRFTAVDDQEIPQSGIIEFQFTIDPKPNQRQTGSSSSSGGGASVLLFVLTLILIARRNSIRKSC